MISSFKKTTIANKNCFWKNYYYSRKYFDNELIINKKSLMKVILHVISHTKIHQNNAYETFTSKGL